MNALDLDSMSPRTLGDAIVSAKAFGAAYENDAPVHRLFTALRAHGKPVKVEPAKAEIPKALPVKREVVKGQPAVAAPRRMGFGRQSNFQHQKGLWRTSSMRKQL